MSLLSLRVRLTLVFALATAAVLVAVGAFLHIRLGDELDSQIERRLAASAATLRAATSEGGSAVPQGVLGEEDVAQIVSADGSVVASTVAVASGSVLDASELALARDGRVLAERRVLDDDPVLLLAEPLGTAGSVVVVGASLESRDDALNGLVTQLAIVIPAALLLASAGGYALAGAALRPVEAMRERAATISTTGTQARLPLPPAHDEIHRLGVTLNDMLGRIEEGRARERQFVADASHELRTPLALLRTELDLSLRRPRSLEELAQALRSASEEVDRLTRLTDDLLLLARTAEGASARGFESLDVRELCERAASRFHAQAERDQRGIVTEVAADLVVTGDPAQLERALGNLVDNALRHGEGAVTLSAEADGDLVVLRVADCGAGFPPEFIPVALDRFTQADPARAHASAGLGLAIAAAVAVAHGGGAHVANAEAGGAVAELRLPAPP